MSCLNYLISQYNAHRKQTDVYVPGKIHVKFYYDVTECEEERKKEFYNV